MTNDNQPKDIGAHLRELVEASKAPGANLQKLYDRAETGILSTVPDKPLVVGGTVLQPGQSFLGQGLPDWEPKNEKTGLSLDDKLKTSKQRGSGPKKRRDR